ncbi:unnamed protein product, partial [Prorocentrum cordatum]
MADGAPAGEIPASLVEQLEQAPTFPSQDSTQVLGRGKGGKGGVPPPRKRPVHESAGAADDMDGADACTSDDYLRQLCRDEFDSMRTSLTTAVSESISATVAENHSILLSSIDKLREQVSGQSAAIDQQVQNAVRPQVDALARRLQSQIDHHKQQIDSCERRFGDHDDQLAALRSQLEDLRRHLAVAEQRPQPAPQVPQGFDRDPDSTLLTAVAHRATSLEAVAACMRRFLSDAGFSDDECDVLPKGTLPRKRFAVHFKGLVQPASRKVLRAPAALKNDQGWKEVYAELPGASDRTLVHVGPDKSPKQVKIEYTQRRCRAAFSAEFPSARFFTDRERGPLSTGWDKVLKVEVAAGDPPPSLRWDVAKLAKHDISKERAQQITAFLTTPSDESAALKRNYLSKLGLDKTIVSLQEIHQVRVGRVPLVPGRALLVTLTAARGRIYIFNILNHALRQSEIRRVCSEIRHALALAPEEPSKVLVIVSGDFDISEESALHLIAPTVASRRGGRRHHAGAPSWRSVFDAMLEVQGSEPTHFESATGKAKVLDRIFLSLQGWQVCQMQLSTATVGSAAA